MQIYADLGVAENIASFIWVGLWEEARLEVGLVSEARSTAAAASVPFICVYLRPSAVKICASRVHSRFSLVSIRVHSWSPFAVDLPR